MTSFSLSAASWQFRDASTRTWLPATVPGCVHSDLLAAKKISHPFAGTRELELQWISERDWEYRIRFKLSVAQLKAEVHDLVADGLDTIATVKLNGKVIAQTHNMFVGHRWNVTRQLRQGRNELRILFRSATRYVRQKRPAFTPPREFCDPVGNAVRIRKQPSQFGWDWAPRLVTCGIWRELRLESWTGNRLADVRIGQVHQPDGRVLLTVTPEFARQRGLSRTRLEVAVVLRGQEVVRVAGASTAQTMEIPAAERWWPAGQGAQPLYEVTVRASGPGGEALGEFCRRIGLRTIALDRHADQWGESFQLVVNGRPVFAKGANWVPAHSFVAGLTRDDYARDLRAAAQAHMNCVRVWGGGVYESEHFYDLCDELGLMVWQDFMFACALYPSDHAFVTSVRQEAEYQVERLRHRACLALWCGNNELAQLNAQELRENARLRRGYERIFHRTLPAVLAACDGVTAYWPSSEWRGTFASGHALGERSGDSHYWDVWHARHPVKDYERWAFRFCSEFGMQSYSSPATNATFCPLGDSNVFGPTMEHHQKNRAGNQIILDYVSRRYRFPKSQDALIYLSQLNQAYCMQVGVEHYRRLMPRCMGALYWQLNDCWPAASWSSIEFTGRWKALHHAARRFNAPALVSAHVPGDEQVGIGNYRQSSVDDVHLYTVCDAPAALAAELGWDLFHFDGQKLLTGASAVSLRPGESKCRRILKLAPWLAAHGRDALYLRIALRAGAKTLNEQTVLFAPPRFIALPRGRIHVALTALATGGFRVEFESSCYHHAVAFDLAGLDHESSDNFFDLYPHERKVVTVIPRQRISALEAKRRLRYHSLVDTYE